MSATLRVVLGLEGADVPAAEAEAALALADGLVRTAPTGCFVEAIVPKDGEVVVAGIASVHRLSRTGSGLAQAWARGLSSGAGGGLIHAPTLLAPLFRHDRLHDNDQTVVTIPDLSAWDAPETLPRERVAWHRRMLRRAVRHADAIVVPAHSMAARLGEIARVGDRVRVIAGAAPLEFSVPADAEQRRERRGVAGDYLALTGPVSTLAPGLAAARAAGRSVVVIDADESERERVTPLAQSAGLAPERLIFAGGLSMTDRAALLAGAGALVATGSHACWPWHVVEAMTLGVPVVAVDSGTHEDVLADGGLLVPASDIPEAVEAAVSVDASRLRVLGQDRARAFSWASAGERVWALHADL